MPGWLKVLLIVIAIGVLLIVGVVGVGVYWISRNKDALMARAKEVVTEGKDFGHQTDNQGCVDESVKRYKKEPGFSSVISNTIFMRVCLESSRPTPGFCDNVPKQFEFLKTAEWRTTQCRTVGLSQDDKCQQLFTPVQQFCEKKLGQSNESSTPN